MLGLVALGTGSAGATTILFNDFSSTAGLQINGNAAAPVLDDQGRQVLRLTPSQMGQAGSAFSTNLVSLAADASFSTAFRFRMTEPFNFDGQGFGADGLVFVVQPIANNVGSSGGGLGYENIPTSIGIEFDTWNNGSGDASSSNHVGIDLNGSVSSVVLAPVVQDMNDGSVWTAWVDYNGATDTVEVRIAVGSNPARPSAAFLSLASLDLPGILGTTDAFVGFTAATGAAGANHDVIAWQFNSTYQPIDNIGVPAPATPVLLALALAGFAAVRRHALRA
ncbi:MAG: PEP-CTERM sorting domain-containing protein [Burkholderiales bacterium]|nr:PEP-CTERM sorting domain-containing protein [Burkholderiales bacterium]